MRWLTAGGNYPAPYDILPQYTYDSKRKSTWEVWMDPISETLAARAVVKQLNFKRDGKGKIIYFAYSRFERKKKVETTVATDGGAAGDVVVVAGGAVEN